MTNPTTLSPNELKRIKRVIWAIENFSSPSALESSSFRPTQADQYADPNPYLDWEAMERDKLHLHAATSLAEEQVLSDHLYCSIINTHPRSVTAFHRLQRRNPHISSEQQKKYHMALSTCDLLSEREASRWSDAPSNFDFGPYLCEGCPYDLFDLRDAIDELIVVNRIRNDVAFGDAQASASFDRLQAKGQFYLG